MCGIFGIVDAAGVDREVLVAGTRILQHRGPDAEGFLLGNTVTGGASVRYARGTAAALPALDDVATIALGFRRLAIQDPSEAGHQPMAGPNGQTWLVFNGEVYNFVELREELAAMGYGFRTGTDTEVILAAYQAWGERCVERFIGMWAFVLWDTARHLLVASRDRMGVKPLYYSAVGGRIVFASEIKALLEDPRLPRSINERRVAQFIVGGRVNHTADTLFDGILQVPSAHTLVWNLKAPVEQPRAHRYWDVDAHQHRSRSSADAYAEEARQLLTDSVRLRLRSDVSIGTCLSGGLDSSSIVCLVQQLFTESGVAREQIGERQRTFTSCFDEPQVDEREYALEVTQRTGAEDNLVFPQSASLLEELPAIIKVQDEPFGGTSIYAQWCVFRRAAERGVRVMLDGQGGDELFAGYSGYRPFHLLSLVQHGRLLQTLAEGRAMSDGTASPLRAVNELAAAFWGRGIRSTLRRWLGRTPPPGAQPAMFRADALAEYADNESWRQRRFRDVLNEALYRELRDGLPSLLRYEDRDSMAFSIEARVPFLDHRLIEFAFSLPGDQKIRDGWTKHVLRRAMRGVLPEKVRLRRDKLGFSTPETTWFKAGLAKRALNRLGSAPAIVTDVVRLDELRAIAQRAQNGEASGTEQTVLWRTFNVCAWMDAFALRG